MERVNSKQLKTAFVGALISMSASSALAHTSYMLPNIFSTTTARTVTVQSSFAEKFFMPEVAVNSDDFHVVHPDGSRDDFDTNETFSQLVLLEEALEFEGTYLLTTGQREGRKSKMQLVDGEWRGLERDHDGAVIIPENAEIGDFQTLTVADAYITKGAPTNAVLRSSDVGLEISPVTHPSEIYLDEEFEFKLMFNGEPLAGHNMTLYRAGGAYEEPAFSVSVTTEDDGAVALEFEDPGVYLIMTRHRAAAPDGADTPFRSYTTSLTFEVIR